VCQMLQRWAEKSCGHKSTDPVHGIAGELHLVSGLGSNLRDGRCGTEHRGMNECWGQLPHKLAELSRDW